MCALGRRPLSTGDWTSSSEYDMLLGAQLGPFARSGQGKPGRIAPPAPHLSVPRLALPHLCLRVFLPQPTAMRQLVAGGVKGRAATVGKGSWYRRWFLKPRRPCEELSPSVCAQGPWGWGRGQCLCSWLPVWSAGSSGSSGKRLRAPVSLCGSPSSVPTGIGGLVINPKIRI